MSFRFALLKPTRASGAEAHNRRWLGAMTLGIEVTEPTVADRCGLGNIDPQHIGAASAGTAIEAALTWPLPPGDAVLVTIRPDADAYGAMAVLELRMEGREIGPDARARFGLIAAADCFSHGSWPGLRPLPSCVADIDEVGTGPQFLGALHAGIASKETRIEEGVHHVRHWLVTGEAPAEWIERAGNAADALFDALTRSIVLVREAIPERIAIVEGMAPGSLRLGYRRAPVVLAETALGDKGVSSMRKLTIAQYREGFVDLRRAAAILSAMETGWGGSETIISSPQGASSAIPVEKCLDVLRACWDSGSIGEASKDACYGRLA